MTMMELFDQPLPADWPQRLTPSDGYHKTFGGVRVWLRSRLTILDMNTQQDDVFNPRELSAKLAQLADLLAAYSDLEKYYRNNPNGMER